MIWIAYGMGLMVGLILLGIFALQVLYAVAEYRDRVGDQCGAAREREESQILMPRQIENPVC